LSEPVFTHAADDANRLAAAGIALMACDTAGDVFDVMRDYLAAAAGGAVAIVSRCGATPSEIVVHAVTGMDASMLVKAASLAGFEVVGKRSMIDDRFLERVFVRSLQKVDGGFAEFAANDVPAQVARIVTNTLGIRDVYIIGITDGETVFGNISILTLEPDVVLPAHSIESLVYMAFMKLSRIEALSGLHSALTEARRYGDALDQVNAFIYLKDRQGRYVYANRATLELFGCSADELVGTDDSRYFPADAVVSIKEVDARVLEHGERTTEEIDVVEADGYRRVYWGVKTPVYDDAGEIWGLCGVSTDTTDRKIAEESLAERQAFIETLLENAPIGFAVNTIDDGASQLVSRSFETIYGLEPGSLEGVGDFFEKVYLDPVFREQMRDRTLADMASGDASRMRWEDVPITTASGEHKVITAINIPLPEQNLMISTVQDVTQRWQAEEALRESEQKYRTLTESMSDVVWTLDPETLRFTYVSPSVTRLRGFSPEEIMAEPMDAALTPEGAQRIRSVMAERVADRRAGRIGNDTFFTSEVEQPCKDGSVVTTDAVTNFYLDERTGHVEVRGVTRDITARKAAEAELAEYRRHLEALVEERTASLAATNEELQKANEELREATEAKNEFLASMSHELRTPLNSIIGFSGILSQGLAGHLNDEQSRQMEMVNRSGRHLLSLIDNVLDLAKVEAGKLAITLDTMDPDVIIREVAEAVRPLTAEKGLTLEVLTCGSGATVLSDAGKVRQILFNLIGNAVKFTDVGSVHVSVHCVPGGDCTYVVADTGPGIAAADLSRIFESFTQLESRSAAKAQGTGLGLRLAREYAHLLGGEITVTSVLGEGSVFTLTLPPEPPSPASTG